MTPQDSVGRTEPRTPDVEAGSYIEDDPAAWEAFLEGARRYFTDNLAHLRAKFGDDGIGIAAGAMLSYLADEHGVYLGRDEATRKAESPASGELRAALEAIRVKAMVAPFHRRLGRAIGEIHGIAVSALAGAPADDLSIPDLGDREPKRYRRARLSGAESPASGELPSVNPERTVRQHSFEEGGAFELRVMETGRAVDAGVPFPPHIVYVDRDDQDRRRTTYVADVHENAIAHARALVRGTPRDGLDVDQQRLAEALRADAEDMTYEEWVAPETDDPWQGLAADVLIAARRARLSAHEDTANDCRTTPAAAGPRLQCRDVGRTEPRTAEEAVEKALLFTFQLSNIDYRAMQRATSEVAFIRALEQDGYTVTRKAYVPAGVLREWATTLRALSGAESPASLRERDIIEAEQAWAAHRDASALPVRQSHGEYIAEWLNRNARANALGDALIDTPYMNDYVLDERNRPYHEDTPDSPTPEPER